MADDFGHVGRTIEDIKRQIESHIQEAGRLVSTVNTLETMLGLPVSNLADFVGVEPEATQVAPTSQGRPPAVGSIGRSSARAIKPDQFLGDPPLEAAKKYLQLVGHAAHFDEISDAVQKGGAATRGADWRDKLEMSLLKSVYEVVKVQDKTYGLISFYTAEQIKGLRGTRRAAERTKPKRGRGKPKSVSKKTEKKVAGQGQPVKKAKGQPTEQPSDDASKKAEADESVTAVH